jgi:hypothetical protein
MLPADGAQVGNEIQHINGETFNVGWSFFLKLDISVLFFSPQPPNGASYRTVLRAYNLESIQHSQSCVSRQYTFKRTRNKTSICKSLWKQERS